MIEEAYARGSLAGLPWRETLRVTALLAREGRLPDDAPTAPDGRWHDLLRAVLGNLPWEVRALERDVDWLERLPGGGIAALHLGCCLRPAEASALLAPARLEGLLDGLRARCLEATPGEARSVEVWRAHAGRLLAAARGEADAIGANPASAAVDVGGASPASAAGLELARWRARPPDDSRANGARRSLAREATMWDGGSRLLQALTWMEGLPTEEQAALLLEKRALLLRGVRGEGEPGLLLSPSAPVRDLFWRGALREDPRVLDGILFRTLLSTWPVERA